MNDATADTPLTNSKGDFALEPDAEPGKVPAGVIDKLRSLRTSMNEASTDFRDAINVQADKHRIKRAALRRYVIALGNDKVDAVSAEVADLERLIEAGAA